MKLKTLVLAAAVALVASVSSAALTVGEGAGVVTITTAEGTKTLKAGDTVPAGAQVTVTGGNASFTSGGVTVNAPAGAGFTYGGEGKNGTEITGTAGSLTVGAGKSVATVNAGSGIAVAANGGKVTVAVTSGNPVSVTTNGKAETVKAGFAMTATETQVPSAVQSGDSDTIEVETIVTTVVAPLQAVNPCNVVTSPVVPCP